MDDFIKAGDNIVLDINSSKFAFIKLRDDGTVKISGHVCSSEPLLGARFGSAFVLDEDKCLSPTDVDPHAFISSTSTTERVRVHDPASGCIASHANHAAHCCQKSLLHNTALGTLSSQLKESPCSSCARISIAEMEQTPAA